MGTAFIIIATCITATATAVIAWYAIANHKLTSKLQSRDEEFRQQVRDLYQAIVISTFIIPEAKTMVGSTLQGRISIFREYYKGKTHIFD